MKNGHEPGYKMRAVGDVIMYYCPQHPELYFKKLKEYDLHVKVAHRALASGRPNFMGGGRSA